MHHRTSTKQARLQYESHASSSEDVQTRWAEGRRGYDRRKACTPESLFDKDVRPEYGLHWSSA